MSDQDPLAALMEVAKRKDYESKAKVALSAAKVALMCGTWKKNRDAQSLGASAFFTRLVLAPKYEPCWDVPTACTDGGTIRYNPEYVSTNSKAVIVGLLAEEGGHTGFGHHVRMAHLAKQYGDDFSHKLANIAADLALLGLLKQSGFDIPAECCVPGEKGPYLKFPKGEPMEAYYALLHKKRKPGDGDGTGGDGGFPTPGRGEVTMPKNTSAPALKTAMQKSKELLSAAAQEGKNRGELPGDIEYLVSQLLKPKIDATEVLSEFLCKFAETDRSWQRPNRRYASQGIYLPSEAGQSLGHIGIANDTSGSLDNDAARQRFLAEAVGMISAYPMTKCTVAHHDSRIQKSEEWSPADGSELPWHPRGGGGTSHIVVMDFFDNLDEPIDLLICFTDLETVHRHPEPAYPVLWCTVKDHTIPYGTKILIPDCEQLGW